MMETMDELLAKYMLGEAATDEISTIDAWIKASDDNRKHFNHFKLIWQTSELLKTESKLDPDRSWAEFKQIAKDKAQENIPARFSFMSSRWLKIAAIWLVVLGAAGVTYTLLKPQKVNMLTILSAGQVMVDTLPDGSVITLNKNSVLVYPERFTGDTREIKLSRGEAFFNIEPNKAKPFLIHIHDAVVKVVGTSFNIKTSASNAEIIVESGIVQVIRKKVNVRLHPKDKADIDYSSGNVRKGQSTDELYNYYRTKQLIADNTPLWRVIEVLNEIYKANIVIGDIKLARKTLTTTFNTNLPLDSSLKIIGETFNVKIVHRPGQIIIQ